MTKAQDFLNKAPEFLVAFDSISTQGFFETIDCTGNSYATTSGSKEYGSISFKAVGYIPDNSKDQAKGIAPFVTPQSLLESIRQFLSEEGCKLTHTPVIEVVSENWPRWNRGGREIIGSRGRKFTLRIFVQHERKKKK
jgi:hypothetical protein